MKKILLFISIYFFLFNCNSSFAQTDSPSLKKDSVAAKEEAFIMVSEMPEFPGGLQELYKFIGENIEYPERARKKGIEGKCFLRFVVTTEGTIGKVEVQKGVAKCKECDEQAVNAVKKLPQFKPGKNDGVAVPVWFQLPINFKLK